MERVLSALDDVIAVLTGPAEPRGDTLSNSADELATAVVRLYDAHPAGSLSVLDRDELGSRLGPIGQHLLQMNARMQRAVLARGPAAVAQLLAAALQTLDAACDLALHINCDGSGWQHLVGCSKLVLGTGRLVLEPLAVAHHSAGAAGALPVSTVVSLAQRQLSAVSTMLDLATGRGCDAATEACAARAFPTSETARWLAAEATALLGVDGGKGLSPLTLKQISSTIELVVGDHTPAFLTGLRAKVAADAALQHKLAQLLHRSLAGAVAALAAGETAASVGSDGGQAADAGVAASYNWRMVWWPTAALQSEAMRAGMTRLLVQERQSVQQLALQLLQRLPVSCPDSQAMHPSSSVRELLHFHVWAKSAALLWRSHEALATLPADAGQRVAQQVAGWGVVALLPRLAAVLRALLASAHAPDQLPLLNMSSTCARVLGTVAYVDSIRRAAQLRQALLAADAAARLLPLLLRPGLTDASPTGEAEDTHPDPADVGPACSFLALRCLAVWSSCCQLLSGLDCAAVSREVNPAEVSAVTAAACQLHATSCRLIHWTVAAATREQMACVPPLSSLDALHTNVTHLLSFLLAWQEEHKNGKSEEDKAAEFRLLQSALAAHWAEMKAVAAKLGPIHEQPNKLLVLGWALNLSYVAGPTGPRGLFQAGMAEQLVLAVASVWRAEELDTRQKLYAGRAMGGYFCSAPPRIMATLVLSGLLQQLLSLPSILGNGLAEADPAQLTSFAKMLLHSVWQVQVEAEEHAAAASGSSNSVKQLAALAAQLAAQLPPEDVAPEQAASPHILLMEWCAALESSLPTTKDVAAILQQHYSARERHDAANIELELAQLAATRSCAYLCCANLGGEGGPAAGQGVGSQKCSACRAVWYCGTACSHADWRQGGHKRVCKALAASRTFQGAD